MDNIDKFIESLSLKDKKTLSQKCLKMVEEVGELSRVILPYDSAHGTNHRFIDREAILEEIVDIYLTNISIFYSLNFTQEEFSEMLLQKATKWSKIQSSEETSVFPLPYEIHITVETEDIESFKKDCKELGVKPIVIELGKEEIKDVMTSSKFFGDNRTAYEETLRLSKMLDDKGYNVVRKKIETVPWHPASPKTSNDIMKDGTYFESHIGVFVCDETKQYLQNIVDNELILSGTAKLSKNFFKKSEKHNNLYVNMLTYRKTTGYYESFLDDIEKIKNKLDENGFTYQKVEVEYAIYDTKINHDNIWI